MFGRKISLFLERLEIEEFYNKNCAQKKEEPLLDVGMHKQKQFWNWDAKRSPKTKSPHIGHIKLA